MTDTPLASVNGFNLFISVQPVIIGFNPENADMTYPRGEIYGRLYSVSATNEKGSYLLTHHEGYQEEGLALAVSDVAFFSDIQDFNPTLVQGHSFESSESSYDWAF